MSQSFLNPYFVLSAESVGDQKEGAINPYKLVKFVNQLSDSYRFMVWFMGHPQTKNQTAKKQTNKPVKMTPIISPENSFLVVTYWGGGEAQTP